MCIKALDKNQPLPNFSIQQTVTTLVSSWNAVSPQVIVNCFSKAGISDSSQQVALADEDNPFKESIEEFDELREAHPDAVPENLSAGGFSIVDDHMIVTASAATDSEALSQILDDNDDSNDEIVIEEKLSARASKRETENALESLQNASLNPNKYSSKMENLVAQLEKLMNTQKENLTVSRNLLQIISKKCNCLQMV